MAGLSEDRVGDVRLSDLRPEIGNPSKPLLDAARVGREERRCIRCESEVGECQRPRAESDETANRLDGRRVIEPRGDGQRHLDGRPVVPDRVAGEQDAAGRLVEADVM